MGEWLPQTRHMGDTPRLKSSSLRLGAFSGADVQDTFQIMTAYVRSTLQMSVPECH